MKTRRPQTGSFMIEAIISLLLFAVGLISLMALSAQALNQVGQSKARNDASYMAGELIGEMWVSASVNVGTWITRLQAAVPGATGAVHLSTCTCWSDCPADASGVTGTVAVANTQAVTVCIAWTDRKDANTPRRYQASSMISRN